MSRAQHATVTSSMAATAKTAAGEALDDALKRLHEEEETLKARLSSAEHRDMFRAFLARKRQLAADEERLAGELEEAERQLAQVRASMCDPRRVESFLPADNARRQLFLHWKQALAERAALLRRARQRKYKLMRSLKARHEAQIVMLETERRQTVEQLRGAVESEKKRAAGYAEELSRLDTSIAEARSAMQQFRQEFEQLRVALLVDRMAKTSAVAGLADRKRRLEGEAEEFKLAVELARKRASEEESKRWETAIAEAERAASERVEAEKAKMSSRLEEVKASLTARYEEGFKPLLAEAEARHMAEVKRVARLQAELREREAELARVEADIQGTTGGVAGGAEPPPSEEALREFEALKGGVVSLWETLDVPADDIMAFLSECDLLAPYSPQVLQLYQSMHKQLTGQEFPLHPIAATDLPAPR
jgi:hypothetical protein